MKAKSNTQKGAEAKVEDYKQELGPFVVAAETTRMPMIFTNAEVSDEPIIFANDAFLKLTGYAREEVMASTLRSMLAEGEKPEAVKALDDAFTGKDRTPELKFRRKDGSEFWASMFVNPVRDEAGAIVQHFASLIDETRHKTEQYRSRLLIDELNHRVKNTLATVQAITHQALRKQSDPEIIRQAIESRIFALSRSHDLLSRANWGGTALHDLIDTALEPFRVAGGREERFVIRGDNVLVPPKSALALGIAFNELATNALKYGALSNERGSLAIDWATRPTGTGNRLLLRWQEKNGPRVTPPSRRGFGSQVIERGLAHELEGFVTLGFPPDGVVCTMDIPAPEVANG